MPLLVAFTGGLSGLWRIECIDAEVAETRRQHAYGALVLVGGLLHALQTN